MTSPHYVLKAKLEARQETRSGDGAEFAESNDVAGGGLFGEQNGRRQEGLGYVSLTVLISDVEHTELLEVALEGEGAVRHVLKVQAFTLRLADVCGACPLG